MRKEVLAHIDTRLEAVLLQNLNFADLFKDERLARLVALTLEACRVVATIFHALKPIDENV